MHEIALRLAAKHFDKPVVENSFRSSLVEDRAIPRGGWLAIRGRGLARLGFQAPRPSLPFLLDVVPPADGAKLEVKQSAAHQTWSTLDGVKSPGRFDIKPRKGFYDGPKLIRSAGRPADVYVFAWNGYFGEETDHRNQSQLEFYVVPTSLLPAEQKTIALSGVLRLAQHAGQNGSLAIEGLLPRIRAVLFLAAP